ncbi:MAG: zinc ribbon domain-containing protein [Methanobrevibacter thaueri]|uniref:Zinc ribbon domain-containing protein n=1 Tax=Methanobrevibacter thaueri TaxID=190975 RepID=A0A8T3VD39_9EURY|nr:zinc ribbon domain-containing protein [Methanobrevibacter thaueri]MBE6501255.1 zinc ribbon domain-containing protein [Methanobrevibacter thaueri]
MELKNIFKNSSFDTLDKNKELLEEHDLLNIMGSPNKVFLKFLASKKIDINEDEITEELIDEFEGSVDSINMKLAKIQRQKEIIFTERKVWINIKEDDKTKGSDLILHHDRITIDETGKEIPYSDMLEIELEDGSWSKKIFKITTNDDEEITFEINEDNAVPLKEIIEDNIYNQDFDEIDALLELQSLFEEGKISAEELEARKAIIYSDDVYCTNCGAKIDSDSLFCPECGHEVLD